MQARIADLCDVVIGRTPRRERLEYWGGTTPWVSIRDLNGGAINTTRECISDLAVREVMPRPVPAGTLLFSFKLTIGKTGLAARPLYTNEAIAALPIKRPDLITVSYLKYALEAVSAADDANHAVLGKVLNKEKVGDLRIKLPPLDEQQRIVDILDRAASIQRLRQAADEKLKQIIPALFVDMFGDPATVKTRWPHLKLEQVADIGSGVTKGRKLDPNEAIDVPYLRVANVQDGYLDLSEIKTITIRESEKDKYALQDGDIVMTEGGDLDKLGRGYVWEGNLPYCAHQNHVFRVRPKRELVCPYYLAAYAASPAGKEYFLRVAKRTTGIASINKTQLSALPVPVPPIALQQEFERKLGDLRSIQRLSSNATAAAIQTANAASAAFFAA